VTIPNSVTAIGEWAFCDCSALTRVSVSAATVVDPTAFSGCYMLQNTVVSTAGLEEGNKLNWPPVTVSGDLAELFSKGTDVSFTCTREVITASELETEVKTSFDSYHAQHEDETSLAFFDVSLAFTDGVDSVSVAETDAGVQITCSIPAGVELAASDASVTREYFVVREHEGVCDRLPATVDTENGTVIFVSDKFSTFELVCVETKLYVPGDVNGDNDVDSDDAIYLLFYTLMPEYYPISQPVDYDGSGEVDSDDAIYLLFYTLMPEYYPLKN